MPKVFIQGVVDASPLDAPPPGGGGQPPGIWGPPGPWPTPPIANVPGAPGYPGGGNPPGGAHPEHPIYIPVQPPAESGLHPEHPIYIPVYPAHPIVLPPGAGDGLTDEQKEKLRQFLEGNLPPFTPPNYPAPVRR